MFHYDTNYTRRVHRGTAESEREQRLLGSVRGSALQAKVVGDRVGGDDRLDQRLPLSALRANNDCRTGNIANADDGPPSKRRRSSPIALADSRTRRHIRFGNVSGSNRSLPCQHTVQEQSFHAMKRTWKGSTLAERLMAHFKTYDQVCTPVSYSCRQETLRQNIYCAANTAASFDTASKFEAKEPNFSITNIQLRRRVASIKLLPVQVTDVSIRINGIDGIDKKWLLTLKHEQTPRFACLPIWC
jgi:hypothetical protein